MDNMPRGGNKRTFGANPLVKVNVNVKEDSYLIRSSNR